MKEELLLELINKLRERKQEWNTVDAKQGLSLQEMGEKAEFVKDVVAMANNREPSYIVIGLADGTFTDVGKLSQHFTKNNLNQFLADKIDPPVVVDYQEFTITGNEYGVVEINGVNAPYIVRCDISSTKTDRKRISIYKGTIFVRHGDRTEGISRPELDEMFKWRGPKEFEHETERAKQIVLGRPQHWEFSLTEELLSSKLAQVRRSFDDLKKGLIYKKTTNISGRDCTQWLMSKCEDLVALLTLVGILLNQELTAAWGKPGEAGDAVEIKRVSDKLVSACNGLLEWEVELRAVVPPKPFLNVRHMMEGWAFPYFEMIESLPVKLRGILQQPGGTHKIEYILEAPNNIQEVMAEIARLAQHPEELL